MTAADFNKLLDESLKPIKEDLKGLKQDVSGLKKGMSSLQDDMSEVKHVQETHTKKLDVIWDQVSLVTEDEFEVQEEMRKHGKRLTNLEAHTGMTQL